MNTVAASDSAVDANDGAKVVEGVGPDAAGPVPTVDSRVRVKLAVLMG